MKLAPQPLLVRDCTGRMVQVPRPLMGAELYVAWSDTRAQRTRIDDTAAVSLDTVAARHRRATWAAMANGWQPGEYDRVLSEFVPEYERALGTYVQQMSAATERWAVDEARRVASDRSAPSTMARPGQTQTIAAQAQQQADRTEARTIRGIGVTARAMAMRVQGEVAEAYANGARPGSWASAITATSLAMPARALGQVVESEGRIAAAASLAGSGRAAAMGLQLVAVVRTSVNDFRRCSICTSRDGDRYELPADQREFEANPLPDPECLGGTRYCRCGYLLQWARIDTPSGRTYSVGL